MFAPIISSSLSDFAADGVNEERLNYLTKDVLDVCESSSSLPMQVDSMVDSYYSVMDVVN